MPKYKATKLIFDKNNKPIRPGEEFEMDARTASHWVENNRAERLDDKKAGKADASKSDTASKSSKAGPDDAADKTAESAKSATTTASGKSDL